MGHPHPAPPAGPKQAQRLRAVLAWFQGQPAAAIPLGWKYHEDDAITLSSLSPSVGALGVCRRWIGMEMCMREPPGDRLWARERRAPGEAMLRDTGSVVAHPQPHVVW